MSKPAADWDSALVSAGLVDPRNGNPSRNQLAKRVGMSSSALNAVIDGRSEPRAMTIQKIADALGVDVRIVSSWVGQERTERDPYAPPAEADLLTDRQRRAVDEIIRAIVAERVSDRDDDQDATRMGREAQPDGITTPARKRRPRQEDYGRAADASGPSLLDADDARAAARGEESQDPEDWL